MRTPSLQRAPRQRYFLLRRWTRVFFSSLRCFFFAMRLRRFLMTEPTRAPQRTDRLGQATRVGRWATKSSAGLDEAVLEVFVDGLLRHPEGPTDPHSGQRPTVDQPVDRHLGHAH